MYDASDDVETGIEVTTGKTSDEVPPKVCLKINAHLSPRLRSKPSLIYLWAETKAQGGNILLS